MLASSSVSFAAWLLVDDELTRGMVIVPGSRRFLLCQQPICRLLWLQTLDEILIPGSLMADYARLLAAVFQV